jgi:DNA-binding NarL/FixJ family response regulator
LLRESLVVLTHDPGLIAAVRAVAPAEHELIFVGAEAELANHLIADSAGVVVLDTAATVNSIAQLTQRLKAQFPDLVLVVTGGATEQAALSAQVTSGNVYRFLHKPASEQRIRLFIDAAWRRRASGETTATTSTLAQPGKPAAARRLPLGTLATVVVSIAVAAGLVGWWLGQHPTQKISAAPPAGVPARVPPPRPVPSDAALNPLLERANEAFARGDWLLPPGNSAAELYRQALEHHPGDAQALAGLDKVVDQVLSAAEQDLLGQHLDEAEHLTAAARAIAPNSVRVSFLATQITRERERAARSQAAGRRARAPAGTGRRRTRGSHGRQPGRSRALDQSGCGRWRRPRCRRHPDARFARRSARRTHEGILRQVNFDVRAGANLHCNFRSSCSARPDANSCSHCAGNPGGSVAVNAADDFGARVGAGSRARARAQTDGRRRARGAEPRTAATGIATAGHGSQPRRRCRHT